MLESTDSELESANSSEESIEDLSRIDMWPQDLPGMLLSKIKATIPPINMEVCMRTLMDWSNSTEPGQEKTYNM